MKIKNLLLTSIFGITIATTLLSTLAFTSCTSATFSFNVDSSTPYSKIGKQLYDSQISLGTQNELKAIGDRYEKSPAIVARDFVIGQMYDAVGQMWHFREKGCLFCPDLDTLGGDYDVDNWYLNNGSLYWKMKCTISYHVQNGKYLYTFDSYLEYDRPMYVYWQTTDTNTTTYANYGTFSDPHGYWIKSYHFHFQDVSLNWAVYSYHNFPIEPNDYFPGIRNNIYWYYAPQLDPSKEANCFVKGYGTKWNNDEEFYGYGYKDEVGQFHVPNFSSKNDQWYYIEQDHGISASWTNDHEWFMPSYALDNISIILN